MRQLYRFWPNIVSFCTVGTGTELNCRPRFAASATQVQGANPLRGAGSVSGRGHLCSSVPARCKTKLESVRVGGCAYDCGLSRGSVLDFFSYRPMKLRDGFAHPRTEAACGLAWDKVRR